MSYLVEPVQFDFLNNKDRENVFITDDDPDNSFNFKYVSTSQFKNIIRDVKRRRRREKEESAWASLARRCDDARSEYSDDRSARFVSNVGRLVRVNPEEVDQELKRLKEDAVPERTKRTAKNIWIDGEPANRGKKNVDKTCSVGRKVRNRKTERIPPLAMDEETDSPSTLERSPVSRLEYNAVARKSQSERTLRTKSESDDEFQCLTKHSVHNCCTGRSEDYASDGEDEKYEIRPHPQVAHKILAIQKKISSLLDEINFRSSRIPLPDGEGDLRRRQQRVREFAIRFSRNYLYDLGRQVADIRRHVRAVSPNARLKASRRGFSLHVQAMELKLTSAHQLLLQALNAYCKHIPSSVLKGHPGKLKEILQVVLDLRDICAKIHLTGDYFERGDVEPPPLGKDTENRCDAILSKLRLDSDNESQNINRTLQSTPIGAHRKRSNDKNESGKGLTSRLSMYNANLRLSRKSYGNGRQPVTRQKNSSNNESTSIPKGYHPITPHRPNSSPVAQRIIKGVPKRSRTKIRVPPGEHEISTMMSILPLDSDTGSSVAVYENSQSSLSDHKDSTTRRYSSGITSIINSRRNNTPTDRNRNDTKLESHTQPITDKELSSLVPVIADLMTLVRNQNGVAVRPVSTNSLQAMADIVSKYRSTQNAGTLPNDFVNGTGISSAMAKNKDDLQSPAGQNIGSLIDAENIKFICLRSENDKCEERARVRTKNLTLCNRKKQILRVSESSLEALLKYRENYSDCSTTNPMYTSKSQNKPWDVVAWIADKLVEELIVSVSKEFEIYGVIQKLFELEFKEF